MWHASLHQREGLLRTQARNNSSNGSLLQLQRAGGWTRTRIAHFIALTTVVRLKLERWMLALKVIFRQNSNWQITPIGLLVG